MDIDAHCDRIRALWPQPGHPPSGELVDMCLAVASEHPDSSTVWYDLGIIMQRCDSAHGYTPADYLRCFKNAVTCDASNWEAYQELGYVFDNFFDDYTKAEQAFRTAIGLGAGIESYCGLARVLAQNGQTDKAIDSLSEDTCPFYGDGEIRALRADILAGDWSWET